MAKSKNNHMTLQLQRFLKKMAVACALAFKRGSHEEAERLMRRLEHVAIVLLAKLMFWSEPATVSLLHLAAYHGWLDIVMNHKLKVLCECKAVASEQVNNNSDLSNELLTRTMNNGKLLLQGDHMLL